ncbi:MAG: tetratricopeptide repeat protein [Bacteroidales bacterium]|nr:tetratricopeptide repeat protein [Bacteroidales bacterium]
MRRITVYIVAMLLLAANVACKQREITANMTDEEKLEVLDIKIDRSPKDADLLKQRAEVLFRMHKNKEALYDLTKANEYRPDDMEILLLQADVLFANGNAEESYKTLAKAETIEPDNIEVQLKLGELLFYIRDYDRALTTLTKVTDQERENKTALYMKAFIYKEKGDTANAVQLYRKVCDLYPDYEPPFEELGIIYTDKNPTLAIEYLNTALRLNPSNTNAMYALAMLYQDHNDMENAEALYAKLLDINPHSADALHNLGYIELFYYKDYNRAIEYFTKALECDGHHLSALVNRGCAHELNNETALALADYSNALNLDNYFQPAIDGYNRLKSKSK